MSLFQRKTPMEKEWQLLIKQENRFLDQRLKKKESFLNAQLADKIPANLQSTLDAAFFKAFQLIFDKGTVLIEKTYPAEERKKRYQINDYTDEIRQNRKSLSSFRKAAGTAGSGNVLLSGAAGIGMGILGVGIPDIPVFTSLLLKNIYEIAASFGYSCKIEQEQYFVLLLIEGAMSHGEDCLILDEQINEYIRTGRLSDGYIHEEQVRKAANALSRELLYMKFLQGIPVVGAVGGACDAICMNQVGEYAKLKYQRRLLTKKSRL